MPPLSSREATTFLNLPPATRLMCIERVHHCIELLYSLPESTSRNDCINVLDKHLWAVFTAHYDKPVSQFKPRFKPKQVNLSAFRPQLNLSISIK